MAIFLRYKYAKKIVAAVLVATFVFPLIFSPIKARADETAVEIVVLEIAVDAAASALVTANLAVEAFKKAVNAAITAAPTTAALAVPIADPGRDAVEIARIPYEEALLKQESARMALEVARTRLAQAMATKESIWNVIARGIARMAINRLTINLVEWIRTGADGRPTFLTNWNTFWVDVGNQATGVFIHELGLNSVLCEPWKFNATFGLMFQKPYLLKAKCTLRDAQVNFDKMIDNFDEGGWTSFIDITVKQENNPFGAFMQAKEELAVRIGKAEEQRKFDLTLGEGFFSVTEPGECTDYDDVGGCVAYAPDRTVTPGSYIKEFTTRMGMSPIWQAELAKDLTDAASIIAGEVLLQAMNPHRGLSGIDTTLYEGADAATTAATGGTLTSVATQKINDATAAKSTKESSLGVIQNTYDIFNTLIDETSATDSSGAIVIGLSDITGNGSCLALEYASGEDTSGTAAKIEEFIATLGSINNTEDRIGIDISTLTTTLTTLNNWLDDLNSVIPRTSSQITEITNGLNSITFPTASAATTEYGDLVEKNNSAQTALTACES